MAEDWRAPALRLVQAMERFEITQYTASGANASEPNLWFVQDNMQSPPAVVSVPLTNYREAQITRASRILKAIEAPE